MISNRRDIASARVLSLRQTVRVCVSKEVALSVHSSCVVKISFQVGSMPRSTLATSVPCSVERIASERIVG
jgi:hypothetical protein